MELTLKANIEEKELDQALLNKIETLEIQLELSQQRNAQLVEELTDIMKTQFPKEWFGSRLKMTKPEFIQHARSNKI